MSAAKNSPYLPFLTWLPPLTDNSPRAHRFAVTRWLLDAAFDLRERLERAYHGRARNGWHKAHRPEEPVLARFPPPRRLFHVGAA